MITVTTYIALLRGINVGGRNRVAMAELRAVLSALGLGAPQTYVQSGNAVFTSDRDDVAALEGDIAGRIANELGVAPAVLLRTAEELAGVIAANPYADAAATDPTRVHAAFLSDSPSDPMAFEVDAAAYAPEEVTAGERVLYLHLPDGMGRSPLAVALGKVRSEVDMTIRNWRTVEALLNLARG